MRNRRSHQKVLGAPPTDLSPDALKQWQQVQGSAVSYHRRIAAQVGASHADDVLAKALAKWHGHLRRNGPVKEPRSYFATICNNEGKDHLAAITRLAEQYIEDGDTSLEDEAQRIHIHKSDTAAVENADQAARALKVLKAELSPRELAAWVMFKMYDIDCVTIAKQTQTTPAAVRQTIKRARDKLENPLVQKKLRAWELAPE
ncbi:RNA polymerase sigma factor [Streptomyces virginiae]|uniref:RNA polymerase sigma factor n=1 Tax=Streptomyces virginiae TaxID=1961 RepID=UPI0036351E2D